MGSGRPCCRRRPRGVPDGHPERPIDPVAEFTVAGRRASSKPAFRPPASTLVRPSSEGRERPPFPGQSALARSDGNRITTGLLARLLPPSAAGSNNAGPAPLGRRREESVQRRSPPAGPGCETRLRAHTAHSEARATGSAGNNRALYRKINVKKKYDSHGNFNTHSGRQPKDTFNVGSCATCESVSALRSRADVRRGGTRTDSSSSSQYSRYSYDRMNGMSFSHPPLLQMTAMTTVRNGMRFVEALI